MPKVEPRVYVLPRPIRSAKSVFLRVWCGPRNYPFLDGGSGPWNSVFLRG